MKTQQQTTTAKQPKTPIHVGMRVHSTLYGGRDGTIVRLHGESMPDNVISFNGIMTSGGNAEADIVWDRTTAISRRIPEALILGSVQWRVLPDKAAPGVPERLLEIAEQNEINHRIAAAAKKAEQERLRQNLIREHEGYLEPGEGSKQAAKNIRRQLKNAFPATKFSVTSDHNSINVRWDDGPTNDMVQQITCRYKAGRFDGMTDCYEYHNDRIWPFGDSKYIFDHREYGPGTREKITELANAYYGDMRDGYEADRRIHSIFNSSAIPAGHEITAIRYDNDDHETKLVFDKSAT